MSALCLIRCDKFVLETMNFVLKLMDFVVTLMNLALKMMDFHQIAGGGLDYVAISYVLEMYMTTDYCCDMMAGAF